MPQATLTWVEAICGVALMVEVALETKLPAPPTIWRRRRQRSSSPLFLNSLLAPIPGRCKNRGFNRRNRPGLHLLQSYSKAHTAKQIGREKLKTIFNLLPRSINRLLQNPVLLKREARLALLGVRWSKIVDVVCGNVNENAPADRGCFQEGVQ